MILLPFLSSAKDPQIIDSLKKVVETSKPDTNVCMAYLKWGEQFYLSNPDTAIILWEKAEDIAENNLRRKHSKELETRFLSLKADVYNNLTAVYYRKGDMDRVMELNKKSLLIYEQVGNKQGLALALNNLGFLHKNQGNTGDALESYRKSLKLKSELGDKKGMANTLNNIGVIYQNLGDIERTLDYAHQSLKIFEELEDQRGIALALNNIGTIYATQKDWDIALKNHLLSLKKFEELDYKIGIAKTLNSVGHAYNSLGDHEKGLESYYQSLTLSRELGNQRGEALSLNNIAARESLNGNNQKALNSYQEALNVFRTMNDKKWITATLVNIGGIMLKMGRITESKNCANEGLALAEELGYPINIQTSANLLFKILKQEGKYLEALTKYELFIEMRDSINNEKTQKSAIRQQTKYKFEREQLVREHNEKEIKRIEAETITRRDNLQYSIVLICLLAMGGLVAMLGRLKVSERVAEGLIFFSFLIFFEFALVLADPYIENISGGAPGIKLLFNAGIAALIFPLHSFFESNLKSRLSN